MKNPKLTGLIRAAKVRKETGESDINEDDYYDRLDIDESEQTVELKLEISHTLIRYERWADEAGKKDIADIGYPPKI